MAEAPPSHKRPVEETDDVVAKKPRAELAGAQRPKQQTVNDGVEAVLITCDIAKEKRALNEARNMLSEMAPSTSSAPAVSGDLLGSLEQELQAARSGKEHMWDLCQTGVKGLLLLALKRHLRGQFSVVDIVRSTLEAIAKNGVAPARSIARILPLEDTAYASQEELERIAKPVLRKHFPYEVNAAPRTYAIEYKCRNNSQMSRSEVVRAIAEMIPVPHRVDLKNPQLTVLVEIFNRGCGIAVVERYLEFRKFNIHAVADTAATKGSEASRLVEASAPEEKVEKICTSESV